MKVALFGAAGQVGTDCAHHLKESGYDVLALTRNEVDFSNPDSVYQNILSLKPDFVVNACAYTAVDKAEEEQALADLVNHQSVLSLARACNEISAPLIHLSTDYVFDGKANIPYAEDSPVSPLGAYGATKLAGEVAIQQNMADYIILRTSWVFGEHGGNFVKTMLRLGAERDQLKVVDDQLGRPTYVGDIVSAINYFIDYYRDNNQLPWGVYHCSSEGETSWYSFAKAVFETALESGLLAKSPEVLPIPSSEFPTPAPRPAYSVLETSKLSQFMGRSLPHWQQGLDTLIKNIQFK